MLNNIRTKAIDGFARFLLLMTGLLILFMAVVQLGIWHGRAIQRSDDAALIAEADARAQRLGDMLSVAQDQIESLAIVQALTLCESGNRHEGVWGDGGKSYGRWQFQEASFQYLADRAGLPGLDWQDAQAQTVVGAWALTNGYTRWWSCWSKIAKPSPSPQPLTRKGRGKAEEKTLLTKGVKG